MLSVKAARFGVHHTLRTSRLPAIPRLFHSTTVHRSSGELLGRAKRRNSPHGNRSASTYLDSAPGWNEDLATTSEASVKADKEKKTISEMQEKTVSYAQSQNDVQDDDPEMEPTRASYTREEVNGPLGSAGLGEFEGVVGTDDLGLDERDVDSNGRIVSRRVLHERTVRGETGQANA